MYIRIGKVTNIYPSAGKVKVMYEDEKNTSLPLPMLTMNREYSMPKTGDKVLVLHRENGSSKGFVLGTYYGGGMQPKANQGYRKDFGDNAHASCVDDEYCLQAEKITLQDNAEEAVIIIDNDIVIKAGNVTIEADEITFQCSYGTITVAEIMKRLEKLESYH